MSTPQHIFCHRCGNQLSEETTFCSRCGAKVKTPAERLRGPSAKIPAPPRPPRRHPVAENRPARRTIVSPPGQPDYADYDDDLYDDEYDDPHENVYVERGDRRPSRRPDRRQDDRYDSRQDRRYDATYDEPSGSEYNEQGERIIFRINQAFYPVAGAYIAAIIASLLVAALVAYLSLPFKIAFFFAIVFFIPAIIRHIKLLHTVYMLTDTKVEILTGIFSKSSRSIPLRHIQDVFVSETFRERLIGIGDIIIDTAASESKMSLDNISDPRKYADMILDQLHEYD